jgi:hypothetical protein
VPVGCKALRVISQPPEVRVCRIALHMSEWVFAFRMADPTAVSALSVSNNAGTSSSTLQEFGADLVDVANLREELAVVSQDIGDTELQHCSDLTESKFRARAAPQPSECS